MSFRKLYQVRHRQVIGRNGLYSIALEVAQVIVCARSRMISDGGLSDLYSKMLINSHELLVQWKSI